MPQQSGDRDGILELLPPDARAAFDQSQIASLVLRSAGEPVEPIQRDAQFASILERDAEARRVNFDGHRPWAGQ